ncbi:MAG: TetR/AcrR family transcriptional regulator [Nannocystaceae bacterium]
MALFAVKGVSATSTRKIAQAAGVSEGLLFHHFGSKVGLLLGAAQRSSVLSEHITANLAADSQAPVQVQLRMIARGFVEFLRSDRIESRVFRVLMSEATTNPDLYAVQQSRTTVVIDALSTYFRGRVAAGELRPDLVVEASAQMLLGSLLWFFLTHQHLPPTEWSERGVRYADAVIDQWLRGALNGQQEVKS